MSLRRFDSSVDVTDDDLAVGKVAFFHAFTDKRKEKALRSARPAVLGRGEGR